MKTLVIIQARMAGDRLPGKIREEIAGMSVLEHVVRRARYSGYAVCIAAPEGDDFAWSAEWRHAVLDRRGRPGFVPVYMPNEDPANLLGRYAKTAAWAEQMDRFTGGDGYGCIVRLTADCPYLPVEAIDAVAEAITSGQYDYVETRSDPSSRPNGIDAQAFTAKMLRYAESYTFFVAEREHVTPAMLRFAERRYSINGLEGMHLDHLPPFRITLDTEADLTSLRAIADHVGVDPSAGRPTLTELAKLYETVPEVFLTEEVVA